MNARRNRLVGSLVVIIALVVLAGTPAAAQTFNSGSTGADGPFSPASNTTLALPPTGVFNFTTITIPSGVTVTFTKNAANTPVILLATGAVTISGTINVSGGNGGALGRPGSGGPGGFDGGAGGDGVTTTTAGAGLGPGGGTQGVNCQGSGGSYGTQGTPAFGTCTVIGPAGPTYGSPLLRPIVGGSGGSGGSAGGVPGTPGGSGGGGGGALLIASSGTLTLNSGSQLLADGGGGGSAGNFGGGGGSGGAIRLIAPTITTTGNLLARGGAQGGGFTGAGGLGRIRLEAYTLTVSGGARTPEPTQGFPQPVFPGTGQPSLIIANIGGIAAPATPSGNFLAAPDILLPTGTTNPVAVALTASNIPLGTVIQVTATPQSGSRTTATSSGLTGSLASSTATASINLSLTQTNVLTATTTFPLVASAGGGPIYAGGLVPSPASGGIEGLAPSFVEGEEVTHVRVAAVFGGGSRVIYLTRSGREINP